MSFRTSKSVKLIVAFQSSIDRENGLSIDAVEVVETNKCFTDATPYFRIHSLVDGSQAGRKSDGSEMWMPLKIK